MKLHTMFLWLFLSCFIYSCSKDESTEVEGSEDNSSLPTGTTTLYFPPLETDTWKTVAIDELGWNSGYEEPLYNFLEENGTTSFIILKNGKIAVEKYFNSATATDNNPWFSAGKTLTAFTIGIAQRENLLSLEEASSIYLGTNWSNTTSTQENAITIEHHLMMTTGLDYTVSNPNCTSSACLNYLNSPGNFWYYHNAPYTLLGDIIAGATGQEFTTYFDTKIKNKIGMDGTWIKLGYSRIFYSTARSMARFGLLVLHNGIWDTTKVLNDPDYISKMISTSQNLNQAYGYLWWLNGKSSFRLPGSETEFKGQLIPDAPDDLVAGLGKNDQKLYIVPSQNLVIIRMGGATGENTLGPSGFDNELWKKINLLTN